MTPTRNTFLFLFFLILLTLSLIGIVESGPVKEPVKVVVIGIYDGDTLTTRFGDGSSSSIRLRGICAAELREPNGKESRDRLAKLLREAKEVTVLPSGKKSWGRIVGDVFVDGKKITQEDVGPILGKGLEFCGK